MDLCFPKISVAWTQKHQMWWWGGWLGDFDVWSDPEIIHAHRVMLHGLCDIRLLAGCQLLFADLHARETVWPEARYTSACLWCSAMVNSHVGSGVSCAKQSLNISQHITLGWAIISSACSAVCMKQSHAHAHKINHKTANFKIWKTVWTFWSHKTTLRSAFACQL